MLRKNMVFAREWPQRMAARFSPAAEQKAELSFHINPVIRVSCEMDSAIDFFGAEKAA